MLKRLLLILLVLVSFFPGSSARSGAVSYSSLQPPSLTLDRSDSSGVVLSLHTDGIPDSFLNPRPDAAERLSFPGWQATSTEGEPQVPFISTLIGLPPQGGYTLHVILDDAYTVPGPSDAPPAPKLATSAPSISGDPGSDLSSQPAQYVPSQPGPVYHQDALYPAVLAETGDEAWLRDQRVVRVMLSPYQYNPVTHKLVWHQTVKVVVQLDQQAAAVLPAIPTADSPFESVLRASLLNYDSARSWRQSPAETVKSDPAVQDMPLASLGAGTQYRIEVNQNGVYRLTYADLQQAGVPVDTLDPHTFHMTSQGKDVVIYVDGEQDGRFDPADSILFYGQKFTGDPLASYYSNENAYWWTYQQQHPDGSYKPWKPSFNNKHLAEYTDVNVYWLTVGGSPGPRMPVVSASPAGSSDPTPTYYRATVHVENSNYRVSTQDLYMGEDTWFGDIIQSGSASVTKSYPATLSALAPGAHTAAVRGELISYNGSGTLFPDHHTSVFINSMTSPVIDQTWDGMSRWHFSGSFDQVNLVNGANSVKIKGTNLGLYIYYLTDWYEIDYDRTFTASGDQLNFNYGAGSWKYKLNGFSSPSIEALDITQPYTPTLLTGIAVGASTPYTATFRTSQPAAAQILALATSQEKKPLKISPYTPHLADPALGADYIVITPPEFITASQTLAAFRQSQGLRTQVVNLNDVYNEFTYGIGVPIAIKSFLKYTFVHWQAPAPAYVVLVGDGNWNFFHYNSARYPYHPVYMPPMMAWVDPIQGEVDSDNLLVNVAGNDLLPDLYVGRLLVNSNSELASLVAKLQAYESQPLAGWQRRTVYIADNIPDAAGDFVGESERLIQAFTPGGFQPTRLYLNDTCGVPTDPPAPCPAIQSAITNTLNITGASFVNYIGHASTQRWANEPAFTAANVDTLHNDTMLPVVFSQDCLDSYFADPRTFGLGTVNTLSKAFTHKTSGGAIATFGAGGLGTTYAHAALAEGFYGQFFEQGSWTIGAAAIAARLSVYAAGTDLDLINTYLLFGDPALHVANPYRFQLIPGVQSKTGISTLPVTFQVTLHNTGLVTDTYDLTLTGSPWNPQMPTDSGPVGPGQTKVVSFTLTVPYNTPPDAVSQVTFQAVSRGDRSKQSAADFTVNVPHNQSFLYSPIVFVP